MLAQISESQTFGLNEEGDGFFQDIELLQSHGINVADIKKLKSAGICTIRGIQMTTKKKLCAIKGLSEAKVDKMKEAKVTLMRKGVASISVKIPLNSRSFILEISAFSD